MSSIKDLIPSKARVWLGAKRIALNAYIRKIYLFRYYYPIKARQLRKKDKINVIFALSELGMWKTENLYLKMLDHPRFNPVLRVTDSIVNSGSYHNVIKYLKKKGYDFEFVDKDAPLQQGFKADIVFYQKPYEGEYFPAHSWENNRSALFCYCPYFVHDSVVEMLINTVLQNICWQNYFESDSIANEIAPLMHNRGKNIVVTGLPMFDQFLKPRDSYSYDWKKQDKTKIRIIYAPHFSISYYMSRSTFLENGEFMLEMAKKYKDDVQIVFKPHPLLLKSLTEIWGEEKANEYYRKWDALDNGQVELGEYVNLFMTSDAMIHDCGSFATEYMFTGNPVMFLYHPDSDFYLQNKAKTGQKIMHLHYKGINHEDIENFIINLKNGVDPLKKERHAFFEENLKPVSGKDACDNIIDAILNK